MMSGWNGLVERSWSGTARHSAKWTYWTLTMSWTEPQLQISVFGALIEFSRRIQGPRALCKSTEICNSWVPKALGSTENNYKRGFGLPVSYGCSEIRAGDFMTASRETNRCQVGEVRGLGLYTYPARSLSCHAHSLPSTCKCPSCINYMPDIVLSIFWASPLWTSKHPEVMTTTAPIAQVRKLRVIEWQQLSKSHS